MRPPAAISSSCSRWLSPPRIDQPCVADDSGRVEDRVRDQPGGDAADRAVVARLPDLGAQQAERHVDQRMVQVREHDVVAAFGERRDRT